MPHIAIVPILIHHSPAFQSPATMDYDKIRIAYGEYVNDRRFVAEWKRMHPKPWKRYVLSFWFLIYPLAIPLGLGIIISGILKHRRINALFLDELKVASTGLPMKACIYMSNAQLRDGAGVIAPALVIGSFDSKFTDDMATDLLATLMGAQMGEGPSVEKNDLSWIEDEGYVEGRRRKIPTKYTGGIEVYAFDLMLNSNWFAGRKLEDSDVWTMATRGSEGAIRQIPADVLRQAGVA